MGELTTLSQTQESDEERLLLPLSPRNLVLLLNWYPSLLDESCGPGHSTEIQRT